MTSCWFHDTRKNTPKLCSTCSSPLTLIVFNVHPAASSDHFSHLTSSLNIMASACIVWKRLHYCYCLQCRLSVLSAKLGEEEGEELGQQPWACHWFTAFESFSPLPHVCVVFPLSVSALPLCLPFALPLCFDLSSSLYPHNLFCSVNLCSVLLYCALYLFLYACSIITVSIRLYCQKCTLISGCI